MYTTTILCQLETATLHAPGEWPRDGASPRGAFNVGSEDTHSLSRCAARRATSAAHDHVTGGGPVVGTHGGEPLAGVPCPPKSQGGTCPAEATFYFFGLDFESLLFWI